MALRSSALAVSSKRLTLSLMLPRRPMPSVLANVSTEYL